MKVLMVTPMPPDAQAPGAMPRVFQAQLTALLERHTVTVITVAGPDAHERQAVERLRAAGVEVRAVVRTEPQGRDRWARRWRLGSGWLRGYPWRTVWFYEPQAQALIDAALTEPGWEVVAVEDNAMGRYQYRTPAPTIYTEHEVRWPRPVAWRAWRPSRSLAWAAEELDWARWRPYQLGVWSRFDRLQTFTARDAEAIQSLAPGLAARVRVNPFGVELPAPADPACERPGALLFVGNYTHWPNVDAALWLAQEIMPRLRRLTPGVRLQLVGLYPPASVRALAGPDIEVVGPVPEIEPLAARAAVVLAPVRVGGGMRMKVLHSMALGKAVVTTPRGAEGLAIDGVPPPLVVAEDADRLARATAALLADPGRRQALGRRARAFVAEHFSPPAYARRLEAIYVELAARVAGPPPGVR